ncbi:hypothetical protein ICJ68_00015 (plasmid) [Staphylococcus lugdunensis]
MNLVVYFYGIKSKDFQKTLLFGHRGFQSYSPKGSSVPFLFSKIGTETPKYIGALSVNPVPFKMGTKIKMGTNLLILL